MPLNRMKSVTALAAAWTCVWLAGCAGGGKPWSVPGKTPGEFCTVREQLVLHSDFPLAAHHRLIEELILRRADLCRDLGLPVSDEPIDVYLFGGEEEFNTFLRTNYPRLPVRRAFFVETDTHLTIYAHWGQRVSEDLRHEVTHGYLHAVVPNLPLWLDEGLAEFFETPRGRQGLNEQHLAWFRQQLAQGVWRPDLARLERLPPSGDMDQADYAEAWAWVHFLLNAPPDRRDVLRAFLADLRREGQAEPISARLGRAGGDPGPALVEHVRQALALDAASNAGSLAPGRL
jgi:hypothetical protein